VRSGEGRPGCESTNALEDVLHDPRDDASLLARNVGALHRVRLTRRRLAVRKDRAVVALEHVLHHGLGCKIVPAAAHKKPHTKKTHLHRTGHPVCVRRIVAKRCSEEWQCEGKKMPHHHKCAVQASRAVVIVAGVDECEARQQHNPRRWACGAAVTQCETVGRRGSNTIRDGGHVGRQQHNARRWAGEAATQSERKRG
jgi:hypothetical protein